MSNVLNLGPLTYGQRLNNKNSKLQIKVCPNIVS